MIRDHQGESQTNAFNEQLVNMLPSMNAFCSVHQGLRVEYSSLIPINLILTSNAKTIFTNFPITDRNLAIELRTLAQAPTTSEQVIIKIQSYFKEFRVNLLHKIEIIEQKMTQKAKQISDFGSIIDLYNKICAKKELKGIVNDSHKELSVKSTEIKTICQEVLSKEQEHNYSITTALERLKTFKSAIDFETPALIKEQILSQIDNIDMFHIEDINQFQELVERKESDKNQNISNLMKLVNNKLNGISVESSERLKESLNKISLAFSDVDIPEIGAVGSYLESLNTNSTLVLKKLVEDLAKNQKVNQEDEERGNKESLVGGDLLKLVSNKTNFCSNEYIQDVAQVVNTLEGVLRQFLVRKPNINAEKKRAFNFMNENQLLNITELVIKMNKIREQNSDAYFNSSTPQSSIQPNSSIIREMIKRHQGLSYLSIENKYNIIEFVDRILVNYPIFELLPLISNKLRYVPIPISLTKTNYGDSQEIQITENGRSVSFSLKNPTEYGQVVSEILDNSLGYLLKLKFNRHISVVIHDGFRIGLIPNSKIHSTYILKNSYESGLVTSTNSGAQIILKGGKLTSEELRKTMDCFEFRFCISKQLFLYADPSYSNINQAEPKHFDTSLQYKFGISFSNSNYRPSDMFVQVTEFGIIDPEEVINFQ